MRVFAGHHVGSAAFSPNNQQVLAGFADDFNPDSSENTAVLFDAVTGRQLRIFDPHNRIQQVVFSPDGEQMLTACHEGTATLWDVNTGKPRQVLKQQREGVNCVAFSPDGERILAGSPDGTIILWNAGVPESSNQPHESEDSEIASTGTAQASPAQTQPGRFREPLMASLHYSVDLERWNVNYFQPRVLLLSEFPIDKRWIEPPAGSEKRLYGILRFGDLARLNLIVDLSDRQRPTSQAKSTVRVALGDDLRFDDKSPRLLAGTILGGVEFTVSYPDGSSQPYAISMYCPPAVFNQQGGHALCYYRACMREGTIKVDGKDFAIAILDDGTLGDYSDSANTTVLIGVNKNSKVQERQMVSARSPFKLGNNFYVVSKITSDGSRVTMKQAQHGELSGTIVDEWTQKGIRGATILCSPCGLSATTDADGRFRLQLPEGEECLLTISAKGYVSLRKRRDSRLRKGSP